MRGIVLAAGAGTRMGSLTNSRPKCLVPMGRRPIVDHQIEALRSVGVDDIVMVVGYMADQIRAHCDASVRFVENPDYESTNSIYSLYLARGELDADTFLFNCDILFHADVLRRMLDNESANVIAVDGRAVLQAGEMNVQMREKGQVTAIGKDLNPVTSQAMSVQLVKFDSAGATLVAGEVERLIRHQEKDAFPTSTYGPLIEAGRLFGVEVGDLPWIEIDCRDDYERALDEVLPRLAGT